MPKLKTIERERPADRTAETVARELADMRTELSTAQNALVDLQNRRRAALLTATIAEIAALDAGFGLADARIDRAEAFIKALEAELADLCAADDGAERESNFERSQQLAGEARKLVEEGYRRHALAIGTVLGRLVEIRREVGRLNDRLPPGVSRIEVEEFRGFSRSLSDVVRLPSITCDEPDFWPVRQRFERADINEIYSGR